MGPSQNAAGSDRDPAESEMAQAPDAGHEYDESPDENQSERAGNPGREPMEPGQEETQEASSSALADSGTPMSEQEQEVEQWLSRVPDDPGGLLREKLRRRYAEKKGVAGMRQGGTTWQ